MLDEVAAKKVQNDLVKVAKDNTSNHYPSNIGHISIVYGLISDYQRELSCQTSRSPSPRVAADQDN